MALPVSCAVLLIREMFVPGVRCREVEYSAIAPPLMEVLFTKDTDPANVITLE